MVILGIVTLGSGIGSMVMSVFTEMLLDIYTWRGVLLIIGGVASNSIASAIICVPRRLTTHLKFKERANENGNSNATKGKTVLRTCKRVLIIMRNKPFVVFAVSLALNWPVIVSTLIIIIDYLISKGLDRGTSVWLLFGLNTANCVARVLTGCVSQIKTISKLAITCVFMLMGGLSAVAFPFT